MIQKSLQNENINTDADAVLKGLELQCARVVRRLLQAALDEKEALFFAMEHIDDVMEMDMQEEKTHYVTEQDKEYASSFSMYRCRNQ